MSNKDENREGSNRSEVGFSALLDLRDQIELIEIYVHLPDGIRELKIQKKYIAGFCHNPDRQSGHLFGQVINEIANQQI